MPSIFGRNFISTQLRVALATIVVVCILGALFPDSDFIPFRKVLEASRTVEVATQATRWLFLVGAFVGACALATWDWLRQQIVYGVYSITRWSNKTFWYLVWGLAIGLRLPVLVLLPQATLRSDELWYHKAAIAIASGRGLEPDGMPTAYRPPGYSALLALTYRSFGPNPEWAGLWGLASTSIILIATYRIAERLYGQTVARIATLIVAVYPALILYTGQAMSDLVFTAGLMLVGYLVTLRPPYRWLETVGIGVALGLLTLTRGVSIGLFLLVPVLWFIKQANVRKLFLHSVLLTLVFVVCLLPWMTRNYTVFGRATLSTNMGFGLYIGNNADASGTCCNNIVVPAPLSDPDLRLNEAEVDRIYLRAAIRFILTHPFDTLSIAPRKILHLFLLEVQAAQSLFQDQPRWIKYGSYGMTQLGYLPILILFALRIFNLVDATMRPRGIQWIGLLITLYFILVAMLFYGQDRYRLPILPWMIIESSVVLAWLGTLPESKQQSA